MARLYILLMLSIPLATLPVLAEDNVDAPPPVEVAAEQVHTQGVTSTEVRSNPMMVGSMEADDLVEDVREALKAPQG